MGWIAFLVMVLGISGGVGWHLGRFQDACTEMTGMMAGMTMGMLNGFVLGFAAAAATGSMFWGNVIGIGLGLTLGGYYGRGGGLMGVMDGTMGGLMGGSMGAMLAVMVAAPEWAQIATGALLALIYLVGMVALIVLIEQRAPQYAGLHRLAPLFARFGPALEEDDAEFEVSDAQPDGLVNYYELFDIPVRASIDRIVAAYTAYVAGADAEAKPLAQTALGRLTNPEARARYDRELTLAAGLDECCPPPRRSSPAPTSASGAARTATTTAAPPRAATAPQYSAPIVRPQARPAAARRAAPHTPAPLFNWRIAVVVTPILVAAGFVLLSGNPFAAAPAAAGPDLSVLQAQAVTVPVGPDGVQTLDLVVNGTTMSYKPSVIQVKQGLPVRFNLSVEGRDPGCGRFVGLRGLGEHGIATPGEVTAFEFTPQQTGKFEINCSMNMMRPGYLLVTQ
jgi:plastocyanin